MIVKDKVDDAEYHDGTDYACRRLVNQFLAVRELVAGSRHSVLLACFDTTQCNPLKRLC